MANAALFRGVCYSDEFNAKQAACSSASLTWGAGHSVISLECPAQSFTGPEMQLCKRVDGGACEMILQPYPAFPDCEHSDGHAFALEWVYLVLPFIVALFFWRVLINMFNGEYDK